MKCTTCNKHIDGQVTVTLIGVFCSDECFDKKWFTIFQKEELMTEAQFNNTKQIDLFAYINKLEVEIVMLKQKLAESKNTTEMLSKTFPNA